MRSQSALYYLIIGGFVGSWFFDIDPTRWTLGLYLITGYLADKYIFY